MSLALNLGSVYNTPIFILKGVQADLRSVYGATYRRDGEWWFPAFWPVNVLVIADLIKLLPALKLPDDILTYNEKLKNYSFPANTSFVTPPYQHQLEGLQHIHRNLRAGLFYDPGLGKCKIVIDLHRITQDKMLILCPKVMLHTWAEEFEKHAGIKDTLILDDSRKKKLLALDRAKVQTPAAVIVTYDSAARYKDELIKVAYSCIVADESHQMKTPFSQRTTAATALANRAYRRILLSGTPSLGSPFDLYGQLRFLGTYFCPENWWTFRKKFGVFPPYENNEKVPKILLGFKNVDIINARVTLISKQKTKEECLDLPDRQIIDHVFSLSGVQKKLYNELIENRGDAKGYGVLRLLEENKLDFSTGKYLDSYVIAKEIITLLSKLDQLSSGFLYTTRKNPNICTGCVNVATCVNNNISPYTTKCSVVTDSADGEVFDSKENTRLAEAVALLDILLEEPNNKIILWTNYHRELDHLENVVKERGLNYVRVHGGMSADTLTSLRQQFNTDPTCRIYLGQVSTGIGITLNAANYVIYYNLPWSLQHYLQSLDRNYRIGQDKKVTVYRLIARHTLDDAKAAALDQKIDFNKLVLSSDVCATCPEFKKRCSKFNIRLYDETCIYNRELERKVVKVRPIP